MNHHIFRNSIRKINLVRMLFPGIFLFVVVLIAVRYPFTNCFFPTSYDTSKSISQMYESGTVYVECNAPTLYYTGYDYLKGSTVKGHYYYSLENNKCTIYLLGNEFFTETIPISISDTTFKARILSNHSNLEQLLTLMARDMNWTYDGIAKCTDTVIISEKDYGIVPSITISILLFIGLAYSIGHIMILLFNLCFPDYAYTFISFGHHRKRHAIVTQAYIELDNSLYFSNDDMYLTDNLFICSDTINIAIIPLNSIIWAYKYSRLHKYFLFGEMTYTLKITTSKKKHYNFLWKSKECVDELLTILSEKNPNILIGYTQENRDAIHSSN